MVKAALKNPHAVIVLALAILVIGLTAIAKLPADILPTFKTPAVQIVTFYPGMPAEVMEKDLTTRLERWTGQANGIARQEAKSMVGVSVVKDFFREDVRSEEHTSELQSPVHLVCRLLLEKKKNRIERHRAEHTQDRAILGC